MPHFNCTQWLEQCLDSLVSQTRPPENIVVADDVSTEDPLPIVSKFPSVTLLRARENGGLATARMAGFMIAGGSGSPGPEKVHAPARKRGQENEQAQEEGPVDRLAGEE